MDPCTRQIFKVDKEALPGFSHVYCVGVVNTTSLSPWSSLWEEERQEEPHSVDRRVGEEPLRAWVQLTGQLAVISFQ